MKILTKLLLSSLVTTGLTAAVIGVSTLVMNQRQDQMNALHENVELAVNSTHQMQVTLNRELLASYDLIFLNQTSALVESQAAKTEFLRALTTLERAMPNEPDVVVIRQTYEDLDRLINTNSLSNSSAATIQQRYQAVRSLRDDLTMAMGRLSDRIALEMEASHQRAIAFEENSQILTQIVGLIVFSLFLGQFLLILVPIVRSIESLQAGAAAIGSGQLDHQLQLHTGDEVEQLGQEFNRMAGRLSELYQSLESRVAERTAQLHQVNQNLATEIAEREEIETVLRQTEADNRALLEALPDLLIRMTGDGIYLDFVQAGEVSTLKGGEQLIGQNIYDIMPPQLAQQRMEMVRRTLETGEPQICDYQITVDGVTHDEEARIVLSGMDEVLVIVRDVSDRKRAERHLHLQHLTARVLAEATSVEVAIEQLLAAICTSLNWTLAEFWAVDPGNQQLQCIASQFKGNLVPSEALVEFQAKTQDYTFALGQGLPGRVWQDQHSIWIPHLSQDGEFRRTNLATPAELNSALGFPVLSESQVLGVITLLTSDQRQPDPSLLDLMTTIGSQIGQLMERHQVEAEVRRQTQRAQLLAMITLRIRQSLRLEKILKTTVSEVRQFLQTDRVVIYRFLPDWQGEVAVEAVGEDWMPIAGLPIQDNCFQTTHVPLYQKGRIRIISDIYQADLHPCHIDLLEQLQVRANLVVPILVRGSLWGLLIAHHCQGPRQWLSDEVQLLEQLSVQMAIALQQAELHEQVRTELQERRQAEVALRQSEARLREQTAQLQSALAELKQLQTQLIQTEKMSSLGQLVGGIAHEINNPVSFIHVNLNYVREYAHDLVEVLHRYQAEHTQPSPALQEAIADKDLDFLMQDLPKILKSMQTGTERIRDIVRSLRNFSRLDEAELKTVDLHAGLDSTLMLLSQRLSARSNQPAIQVIRQYAPNLPAVPCYAGQLNQVFMNILNNAIDALESSYDPQQSPDPTITVTTAVAASGSISIQITDNGPGIPAAIQAQVFDPFFTTKPVGAGTGMGLAVSYQIIVERHRGQLSCLSTPGEGTTFMMTIPQHQAEPGCLPAPSPRPETALDRTEQPVLLEQI